jgi:hypothetical protein
MAFKMRSGNKTPFKLMGAKDAPMKMMKKSPSKLMKKSPAEFNPGLRKAAADGKLDNNPKFKAAVEGAPAKMMKKSAAKLKIQPKKVIKKKDREAQEAFIKEREKHQGAKRKGSKDVKMGPKKKTSPAEEIRRESKIAEGKKPRSRGGLKVEKKNRKQSPAKKMDVIEEFDIDKDAKLPKSTKRRQYKETGVISEGGRKRKIEINKGTGKQAVHDSFEKSIMADIKGKKPKMYKYTDKDKEYVESDAGKEKYFQMRKKLDKDFRRKTKGFKSVKDYDKSRDEAAKNREAATKMMKKSGAKMMKKSGAKMMKKSAAKMMKKDGPKDVKMGPTSYTRKKDKEAKIGNRRVNRKGQNVDAKGNVIKTKPRGRGGLKVPSKVKNASPMKAGQTAGQIVKRERMMT